MSAIITLVISRKLFVGYRDAMARGEKVVTSDLWERFQVEHAGIILRRILTQLSWKTQGVSSFFDQIFGREGLNKGLFSAKPPM